MGANRVIPVIYFKMPSYHYKNRVLYLLLLLIICTVSASAQVLHFDTVACGIDESDTSYINKMVRHQGSFFNKVFDTHINNLLTINVSLYGNERTYIRALKANKTKAINNGVYSAELNKNFVFKNDTYTHVILRATSINLLHNDYPNAPRWLTEGFANVMSYTDETGEREMTFTPLFDYNKQLKELTWNSGFDFDALFTNDNPDWNNRGTAGATLQALSYGIVYFLVTQNRDHLAPIILSMKDGHTAKEAIESSYGSFDEFKKQLTIYYRYAAKSRFSAL
jgi:hypothetical protein